MMVYQGLAEVNFDPDKEEISVLSSHKFCGTGKRIVGTVSVLFIQNERKHGSIEATDKKGTKKRKWTDRAEDKELVEKLKSPGTLDVVRNERQEKQFEEFNETLNAMENSKALTEHKIRCGVCKEVKLVCAADRNNEGKIKYFRRKHYNRCLEKNMSETVKPKDVGNMQQFMKTFLQLSSHKSDSSTDGVDIEVDADLEMPVDSDMM